MAEPLSSWTHQQTSEAPRFVHRRYQLLEQLGRGSVGVVYLAEDRRRRGRRVAVKVLPAFGSSPAVTPERFEAELRAHRDIDHPNVVRVLDHGVTREDVPFLVMERLFGESLGDCLRRRRVVSVTGALRIAREAARGLGAVHDHDLVHRDVKPDNLFLCDEGRHDVSVKVLDFGFAMPIEQQREAKICGTLEYIAPEQVLSERVDRRTDVYALGVVLFRMLTGELPFDASERRGIVTHQLISRVPPPSWLVDDLPPAVDRIVHNSVRKHPDNRYAAMHDLMEDLDRALCGDEVRAIPLSVAPDRFKPTTESGRQALRLLAAG